MEIVTTKFSDSISSVLSHVPSLSAFNAVVACTAVWAFVKLIHMSRKWLHTTRLRGPPSPGFLFGAGRIIMHSDDPASLYESWAREYGSVYAVPQPWPRTASPCTIPRLLRTIMKRRVGRMVGYLWQREPMKTRQVDCVECYIRA